MYQYQCESIEQHDPNHPTRFLIPTSVSLQERGKSKPTWLNTYRGNLWEIGDGDSRTFYIPTPVSGFSVLIIEPATCVPLHTFVSGTGPPITLLSGLEYYPRTFWHWTGQWPLCVAPTHNQRLLHVWWKGTWGLFPPIPAHCTLDAPLAAVTPPSPLLSRGQ